MIVCGVCGADLSRMFAFACTIQVQGGTKIFNENDTTIIGKDSEAVCIRNGRTKYILHDCERKKGKDPIQIHF